MGQQLAVVMFYSEKKQKAKYDWRDDCGPAWKIMT